MLQASFNVRFSPELTVENIQTRVHEALDRHGIDYDITWSLTGRPFLTKSGPLVEILSQVIKAVTGREPDLSTGGGTSDGRFLAAISGEVVEFGPPNESIHKVNERIAVADIAALSTIYERTILQLVSPNPS
jgi:succinyl-diaminopimelate desuccinylase